MKAADIDALAREAVIYGWPLYEMRRMRDSAAFSRIEGVGDTGDGTRWSNAFWHRRRLIRPGDTPIVTPNSDTLYSTAWLDLTAGPVVIDAPESHGRYYVLGFLDFYTNPFANIGQRTTGDHARSFLVSGPGWAGEVPERFRAAGAHIQAPTPWVRIIARIMVEGEADLSGAHAFQDGLKIQRYEGAPAPSRFLPGCDHRLPADAAHFATQVNAALQECPPPASERDHVGRFAVVGIGAGVTPGNYQVGTLQKAIDAVLPELRAPQGTLSAEHWQFMPRIPSSYGVDYLLRAKVALQYLGMLESEEAIYPMAWHDSEGYALSGEHRYVIHFPQGKLPPVGAFWSVTLYSAETMNLVENEHGRYVINQRTPGLRMGSDGSLRIAIQHERPGDAEIAANWLPAPAGEFYLCLRAYLPGAALLDGSYAVPGVTRLGARASPS